TTCVVSCILSFSLSATPRVILSFPTRRSSDLQSQYDGNAAGDVLRLCATGEGSWAVENNGQCGDATGAGVDNGRGHGGGEFYPRSEEHTSELQSRFDLVCRLLLEKKKK